MKAEEIKNGLPEELKRNCFSVPEGYFQMLGENIFENIKEIDPVKNTFEVPTEYFEKLPYSISEKITDQKRIIRPIGKAVLAAASLAVIILLSTFIYRSLNKTTDQNYLTFDELKNSEYLYQIDDDQIIDLLGEAPSNAVSNEKIDFLLDNNIDINQIELN